MRYSNILMFCVMATVCLLGCQTNPTKINASGLDDSTVKTVQWQYKVIKVRTHPLNTLELELNRWTDWEIVSTFMKPTEGNRIPEIIVLMKKQK